MSIIVVRGMDRFERHYMRTEKRGIDLRMFSKASSGIASKIGKVDAVVVFTNRYSIAWD